MMTVGSLDPVEYAILSQSLIAAAREMGVKLIRSAYSTILREARDGSAALLDVNGDTVAQAELIPMQLGSIGRIFQPCAAMFPPATLEPGDFLVINDPYSGGQHLQDVFFFHPIFVAGGIVGFAASVAHHLDLSGGSPGLNPYAVDLYAEGLIIPPMKINTERDWNGGGFQRLLRANVRVPQQTMGDFDAQIAAKAVGVRRVQELVQRYGRDKIVATMAALQDYSETRMRAAIRDVPDGIYLGEAMIDDDGLGSGPLVVRAAVTVQGDSIAVDFAGTSPQVGINLNAPFASVISAAVSSLKAALTSPDMMKRAGMNVDMISVDFGNWLQRRASQAPIDQGGWSVTDSLLPGLDLWDPASHLGLRGNGLAAWPGWPTSPQLESLRSAWFLAPDEARRQAICRNIQLQAWQDVPYIPTGRWRDVTAYRSNLSGMLKGMPIFYNLQKT